ncbi:MAG: hypothetical protein ACR5K5_05465 [Wolbachia sp.]
MDLWRKGVGKAPENIYRRETMRERTLTIHRRYEPSKLSDKYLSDAYEILLRRVVERKNKNKEEAKRNDSSGIICKSFIETTSAEQYNSESNCRT